MPSDADVRAALTDVAADVAAAEVDLTAARTLLDEAARLLRGRPAPRPGRAGQDTGRP